MNVVRKRERTANTHKDLCTYATRTCTRHAHAAEPTVDQNEIVTDTSNELAHSSLIPSFSQSVECECLKNEHPIRSTTSVTVTTSHTHTINTHARTCTRICTRTHVRYLQLLLTILNGPKTSSLGSGGTAGNSADDVGERGGTETASLLSLLIF